MTWVQSAVRWPDEDVFDEDADEMDIAQKEWKRTMEKRVKEGYREGAEAGKEVTVQQGFNQGYNEAAKFMFSCGQLKGTVSALWSWCEHHGSKSSVLSKITQLLGEVSRLEDSMLKDLNCSHPQLPISDLMDAVENMDLGTPLAPEAWCSGITGDKLCENGTQFGEHCCSKSVADTSQSECCRRKNERTDSHRSTFTWLKEETVSLVQHLELAQDTIEHIQLL